MTVFTSWRLKKKKKWNSLVSWQSFCDMLCVFGEARKILEKRFLPMLVLPFRLLHSQKHLVFHMLEQCIVNSRTEWRKVGKNISYHFYCRKKSVLSLIFKLRQEKKFILKVVYQIDETLLVIVINLSCSELCLYAL